MLEVQPAARGARPHPHDLGAAVASVAAAVPERVVKSSEVAFRLGVEERWIESRTGVRERRVAAEGEGVVELAARAGRSALEAADVHPSLVDLLLVATTSHDELIPNAAPRVAAALGAEDASAVDVGAACTGFVAAIDLGAGQIECGRASCALVIGADVLSRHVDPFDRSTAALFGDGAGAVLLAASRPARVGPMAMRSDGAHAGLIHAPREKPVIQMRGPDTFRHAVDRLCEVTVEAAELAELELSEIDLFVYHQANARILRAVGERLGLPGERVPEYMGRYGNTSAASIPIALAEAEADGLLRPGAQVLIGAFGAGLTWGAGVVEWGAPGA